MNKILFILAAIMLVSCHSKQRSDDEKPFWTNRHKPGSIICFTTDGQILFSGMVNHAQYYQGSWKVFAPTEDGKEDCLITNATCSFKVEYSTE